MSAYYSLISLISDYSQTEEPEGGSPVDGMQDPDPCSERWVNLADDSKKTMWGVFVETGVFIAACHHGVIVTACDMIRSGEL